MFYNCPTRDNIPSDNVSLLLKLIFYKTVQEKKEVCKRLWFFLMGMVNESNQEIGLLERYEIY